tara:strand:+ start:6721 stop:10068 length:3348 start_codon:yes stop_codon:yes gene_type:complete
MLGCAPAFWASWDTTFISEDMALPRTPEQFSNVMHSWNPILNAGTPYNVVHAPFLVFAQQAGLQALGVSESITQRLVSMFWFAAPGLSMAFMTRGLLRYTNHYSYWKPAAVTAAGFYMFNLYLEHVWISFNLAVIGSLTVFPAAIGLLFFIYEGRIKLQYSAFWMVVIALIGAPIGINPPMAIVVGIGLLCFCLTYILISEKYKSFRQSGSVLVKTCALFVIALLASSFWLIPFLGQIGSTASGEITAARDLAASWLTGLSANTSFANVLRFQGDWTWYQGWQEPYRPYSQIYRDNSVLGALSWFIPALSVIGLLAKGPRIRIYFGVISLIGLILSMGVHPPMKEVYLWLTTNIPFFWVVRSPWFKFTFLTVVGFSFLSGLGVIYLLQCVKRFSDNRPKSLLSAILAVTVIMANVIYAYPVSTGAMYTSAEERKFLPEHRFTMPELESQAVNWLSSQEVGFRVAVLPDTTVWSDESGFTGFSPMLAQMGSVPVVYPFATVYGSLVSPTNGALNSAIYKSLYEKQTDRVSELLQLLGVKYLLHATGTRHWLYAGDSDHPDWVRERIAEQKGIKFERSFGSWDFYNTEKMLPHFFLAKEPALVVGGVESIVSLIGTEFLTNPNLAFSSQLDSVTINRLLNSSKTKVVFLDAGELQLSLDLIPEEFRYRSPKLGSRQVVEIPASGNYQVWLRTRDRSAFPSGTLKFAGHSMDVNVPAEPDAPQWLLLSEEMRLTAGKQELLGNLVGGDVAQVVIVPQEAISSIKSLVGNELAVRSRAAFMYMSELLPNRDSLTIPEQSFPVTVMSASGLGSSEVIDSYGPWQWVTDQSMPTIAINNALDVETTTNISLTLRSHGQPRDVYIYVNDDPPIIEPVAADLPEQILLSNVVLQPGGNTLRIYSPFAGSQIEGRNLSIGVKPDSLRVGRLRLPFAVNVPVAGQYRIELRGYGESSSDTLPNVELDGKAIMLVKSDGVGGATFVAVTELSPSNKELIVDQNWSEHYVLRIIPSNMQIETGNNTDAVAVVSRSPTNYKVEVNADEGDYLVFNESFDPRWQASIDGRKLAHLRTNSFASAYLLPVSGNYEIDIVYNPQRLFLWGAIITLSTMMISVVVSAISLFRR